MVENRKTWEIYEYIALMGNSTDGKIDALFKSFQEHSIARRVNQDVDFFSRQLQI